MVSYGLVNHTTRIYVERKFFLQAYGLQTNWMLTLFLSALQSDLSKRPEVHEWRTLFVDVGFLTKHHFIPGETGAGAVHGKAVKRWIRCEQSTSQGS